MTAEVNTDERSLTGQGLRLIRQLVTAHPLTFSISLTGALVYALASVLTTEVLGAVTDNVILPTFDGGELSGDALRSGALMLVGVILLRAASVVARRYFAGMTSERVQASFHRRLLDKYLSVPLAWYQQRQTGQLLAHVDNDVEKLAEPLHPLPLSIGAVGMAVFSAVSLFLVDVVLAAVAFVIFPMLFGLNRTYSKIIEEPSAAVQAGVGSTSAVAHESFDGALIVKTLGRAEHESRRFAVAANGLRSHQIRVGNIRAIFEATLDSIPSLGVVLMIVVGAYRLDAGAITRGDLVQVAVLFTILGFPMRVFGYFLEGIPPAVVSHRRLDDVLSSPIQPKPSSSTAVQSAGPLSVRVAGVGFGYADQPPVLADVSFDLSAGEVVALVGSTGSGKSTLAMLLAGLVPPDSGTVEVGGQLLSGWPAAQRTEAIALVFQESFLFGASVGSNIDMDSSVSHEEVADAAAVAQIGDFLSGLPMGYDTVVGERGVTLSGGQRQRVALARALVRKPRLLILDDATSAVDPKVEQRILDGLRAELSTTTLIVAQRLATIMLADRVLYLADGHIAAAGTHEQLLEVAGYRDLVTAYEAAAL